MAYFMIDMTYSDQGLTEEQRRRVAEAMLEMDKAPGASVEHWSRGNDTFYRVVYITEGSTLRATLGALAVHEHEQAETIGLGPNQGYTVSLAMRDVSYDVYASLPSAVRRAMKGGRPTREEVAERFQRWWENPPSGAS